MEKNKDFYKLKNIHNNIKILNKNIFDFIEDIDNKTFLIIEDKEINKTIDDDYNNFLILNSEDKKKNIKKILLENIIIDTKLNLILDYLKIDLHFKN